MAMKTLNDLFVHFLRDIYYAEKQGVKEMRGMARKASSQELKDLLLQHREETEQQVEMLEQVFEKLELRPRGVKCEAMEGIASEAHEIMEEAQDERTRDCGIVATVQAVEHYEISRYGTLIAWGEALGHSEAIEILKQIRDQEVAADQKLSQLAEQTLNPAAEPGDPKQSEQEMDAGGGSDATMEAEDVDAEAVEKEEPDEDGKAAKAELQSMDEEVEGGDDSSSPGGKGARSNQQKKREAPARKGGKKAA